MAHPLGEFYFAVAAGFLLEAEGVTEGDYGVIHTVDYEGGALYLLHFILVVKTLL